MTIRIQFSIFSFKQEWLWYFWATVPTHHLSIKSCGRGCDIFRISQSLNVNVSFFFVFFLNVVIFMNHLLRSTRSLCHGMWGVKEIHQGDRNAHPSPCPHKICPPPPLPPPSPPFHLCLSRSSGRVKLSKSVLIIRTGTRLPACPCVSVCVCVCVSSCQCLARC